MTGIKIIKSSPFTTIQDIGRYGFSHQGVTNSGAMDKYAFNMANKLLENQYGTSALEILWGGLVIEAFVNSYFVLTGASFKVTLNEKPLQMYNTYKIKKGDILKFHKKLDGLRAYLCFKGGFILTKELNSVSTSLKEKIGGLKQGQMVKKDDFLKLDSYSSFETRKLQKKYIPTYPKKIVLRVIESYQNNNFSQKEKDKFYSSSYFVTKDFNSMAYKLDGKKIVCDKSDIISEGIAFGSIQIPANGKPIILLNERQTIGGYPKFGVVFSIDCYKLSQLKEGDEIVFKNIDLTEAKEKLINFERYFRG